MSHVARRPTSPAPHRNGRLRERGVTLIELIVVIVIVGIIAAIALPNYRQYVVRSQRADATTALMSLGTAQEKFYLDNNEYADSLADLRINGTERGWYTLSVACAAAGCAAGYSAAAVPVATGPQASDPRCKRFSIDDRSQRLACKTAAVCASGDQNDTSEECWR